MQQQMLPLGCVEALGRDPGASGTGLCLTACPAAWGSSRGPGREVGPSPVGTGRPLLTKQRVTGGSRGPAPLTQNSERSVWS